MVSTVFVGRNFRYASELYGTSLRSCDFFLSVVNNK